jgi:hypothetical protein
MEATPFEHVEAVALAVNFTEVPTVLPLLGLVTVTLAKADAARKTNRADVMRTHFFIWKFSPVGIYFEWGK